MPEQSADRTAAPSIRRVGYSSVHRVTGGDTRPHIAGPAVAAGLLPAVPRQGLACVTEPEPPGAGVP